MLRGIWLLSPTNLNVKRLRRVLPLQYAIRPTVRNNHEWPRDILIPLVARAVGPGHTVDLKNYDALILVEIMQVSIY